MTPWDRTYADLTDVMGMGDALTYKLAAAFLRDMPMVADWGCGGGGMRGYIESIRYRGVDFARTPYANITADLTEYRDRTPGVLVRHVLEHNYAWAAILDNAIFAAERKLCVVLFTPWVGHTHVLNTEPDFDDVPVIAFSRGDLLDPISRAGFAVETTTLELEWAHFGTETMIYATRTR